MANHVFENNQRKSGRGGARPGAGRKPGSATKKTRELANLATENGLMPLEVMLNTMRKLYDEGDMIGASNIARHAAPYSHPRLAAIDHTTNGKDMAQAFGVLVVPHPMSEAEWEAQSQAPET